MRHSPLFYWRWILFKVSEFIMALGGKWRHDSAGRFCWGCDTCYRTGYIDGYKAAEGETDSVA